MASKTFEANANDDTNYYKIRTTLGNDDDSTEMAGENRKKKDAPEQEKMVKWQLPGHHDSAGAKRALINILAALLINHPQEVTIIDRKQRAWNYEETVDENRFMAEFE